jgi:hypothetical protein
MEAAAIFVTSLTNGIKSNVGALLAGGGQALAARIGNIALTSFSYYSCYFMLESALSDILCLKTYRHGTDPYAAVKITLTGVDLERAGKGGEATYYESTGRTSPFAARDQQRKAFYVAEDISSTKTGFDAIGDFFVNKCTPKYYALLSTTTFFGNMLPLPKSWKAAVIKGALEIINSDPRMLALALLCPTVKFHINPNRIGSEINFTNDTKDAGVGAMWTQHRFSVLDVGMLGILKNGINFDIFSRINNNRSQFVWGVAQLVTAVAFTAFFIPAAAPNYAITALSTATLALEKFGEIGAFVGGTVACTAFLYAGFQL